MKRLFEELLYGNKVDLALWAHNHNYERSCKVYKTNCVSDGIVHLVIGTAGANLDDDVWYPVTYSAYREINYGFGRIAIVNRTALHIQFIRNKNLTVGDDFWILKPDLSELSRGRKNTFSSMTATWLLYISVMWLIHIHNTN